MHHCVDPESWIASSVVVGVSPSGKAAGFDPAIRRFESFHPCHFGAISWLWTARCGLRSEFFLNLQSRAYGPQPF